MQTQMHKLQHSDFVALKELPSRRSSLQPRRLMELSSRSSSAMEKVERITTENAVVVFSSNNCCMSHVAKRLLCSLGVSPVVIEIDEETGGTEMEEVLTKLIGEQPAVPVVFVGGKLVGGVDRLMAAHISGHLIPQLKEAKALWL